MLGIQQNLEQMLHSHSSTRTTPPLYESVLWRQRRKWKFAPPPGLTVLYIRALWYIRGKRFVLWVLSSSQSRPISHSSVSLCLLSRRYGSWLHSGRFGGRLPVRTLSNTSWSNHRPSYWTGKSQCHSSEPLVKFLINIETRPDKLRTNGSCILNLVKFRLIKVKV